MIRLIIITGLVLLGLSAALAQESNRAKQSVRFAVHRADAPAMTEGLRSITATNRKVTVSFDAAERISQDRSLRTGAAHVDANLVRREELNPAFRKRPSLVTVTD